MVKSIPPGSFNFHKYINFIRFFKCKFCVIKIIPTFAYRTRIIYLKNIAIKLQVKPLTDKMIQNYSKLRETTIKLPQFPEIEFY